MIDIAVKLGQNVLLQYQELVQQYKQTERECLTLITSCTNALHQIIHCTSPQIIQV